MLFSDRPSSSTSSRSHVYLPMPYTSSMKWGGVRSTKTATPSRAAFFRAAHRPYGSYPLGRKMPVPAPSPAAAAARVCACRRL